VNNKHVDILTNDITQVLVYSSCTSEAQLIDYVLIGVARGCTGCTFTLPLRPRAEKKIGAKFTGESSKCTPKQRVHPQCRA